MSSLKKFTLALALGLGTAGVASAQPFGSRNVIRDSGNGYYNTIVAQNIHRGVAYHPALARPGFHPAYHPGYGQVHPGYGHAGYGYPGYGPGVGYAPGYGAARGGLFPGVQITPQANIVIGSGNGAGNRIDLGNFGGGPGLLGRGGIQIAPRLNLVIGSGNGIGNLIRAFTGR